MKSINLLFTQSVNGVMGRENEILWHLNTAFLEFKTKTKDQIVLMGKRAWEVIPTKDKPYPDKLTVIVTRDTAYTTHYENVNVVYDLDWYIKKYCEDLEETRSLWVIGGADILKQSLKYADTIEVIELLDNEVGEILAPKIDGRSFKLTYSSETTIDSFNNKEYFKSIYSRISKSCVKTT